MRNFLTYFFVFIRRKTILLRTILKNCFSLLPFLKGKITLYGKPLPFTAQDVVFDLFRRLSALRRQKNPQGGVTPLWGKLFFCLSF